MIANNVTDSDCDTVRPDQGTSLAVGPYVMHRTAMCPHHGAATRRAQAATNPRVMVRLEANRQGKCSGEAGYALMSGELTLAVEAIHPVAVIRPRGTLDAYTAPDLRAALLDCLADQPSGVVIDVSDLDVTDDIALTVLATVARQSRRWPGAPLVVAGGGNAMRSAAERLGLASLVQLYPDRTTAMLEADRWPRPPLRRDRITPDRTAPGAARAAVVDFCAANGIGGDGDAAQLVASELVTNAVVHAGTDIDLTLKLTPPALHIAVRDGGDGHARIPSIVDESSETGRGLLLVDALSTGWGCFRPHTGKVVWATVRVRPLAGDPLNRA